MVYKTKTIKRFIIAAIAISVCAGIYQIYFAAALVMFMAVCILDLINEYEAKKVFKDGCFYVGVLVAGLLLWRGVDEVFLRVNHTTMTTYQGMNEKYDLLQFPSKLTSCYLDYIDSIFRGIHSWETQRYFFKLIFVGMIVLLISLMIWKGKTTASKLLGIILILLLPFGMNVAPALSTASKYHVHTLMVYMVVFTFIIPIPLIEKLEIGFGSLREKASSAVCIVMSVAMTLMLVIYTYNNNVAYYYLSIEQEHACAYYTQLLNRIETCPGYTQDKEIVFVGTDTSDVLVKYKNKFPSVSLFYFKPMTGYYFDTRFFDVHLGYNSNRMNTDDEGKYAKMSQVVAMPPYPDEGSVKEINDCIIVRFNNFDQYGDGR